MQLKIELILVTLATAYPAAAAIENVKGCKGWGEGDYYKITGLSFDECEDHCHDAIDCLAFEYDREDKFCEIWTTFPEKIRRQDGKHCSTWNDDHSFTEHDGYGCRTSDGGKGEERTCEGWGGGDFYKRSLKLDDCLDECINSSEQCKAVEYMYDTGAYHCVIWTSFPEEEEPKKNFDCYKREDAN